MLIDFELPERLIATHPTGKRDHCKMLVFDRQTGKITHSFFNELPTFLTPEYFLVLNQARVNHSRIFWTDTKGKNQEIVFLRMMEDSADSSIWEAIVSGKNLKVNQPYVIDGELHFELLKDRKDSLAHIKINRSKIQLEKILRDKGQLPLPPYILKKRKERGHENYTSQDEESYQTVFSKKDGAVAAPTAGLHFTNDTFAALKEKNIEWDFIHLSVGWGTFAPLTQQQFDTRKLHPEFCEISSDSANQVLLAKQNGKKILAVGTTVVRTLESWAKDGSQPDGFEANTEIFITPPYDFKMSNALLTNFHIPQSSLLLLVAAFLGENGEKKILNLYREAIEKEYQFYSYGDCMLIL